MVTPSDPQGQEIAEIVNEIRDRVRARFPAGETAGIPTILVLSGETQADEVAESPHQPSYVFENLGAVAHHLMNMNS